MRDLDPSLNEGLAPEAGMPYKQYLDANILRPLGMTSTTLEVSEVSTDRIARGYRWEGGTWKEEELLAHGSFGPMGGLWTSTRDLARYVAFLMSAFPPRDDAETGPLRRASAREMQQVWRMQPASVRRPTVDAPLLLSAQGYGYGLGVQQDCRLGLVVAHGGGLPGYGSLMAWLPDRGVGVIALGNVTYAGWGGTFQEVLAALDRTSGLRPRHVQPSAALRAARDDVARLIVSWNDSLASRAAADNLFMDHAADTYQAEFADLARRHGACRPDGDIVAENALRGEWRLRCERGSLTADITLAPTAPPRVQHLSVRSIMPLDPRMTDVAEQIRQLTGRWDAGRAAALAAPSLDMARAFAQLTAVGTQWGACRVGDAIGAARDRLDGYRDALADAGCVLDTTFEAAGNYTPTMAAEAMRVLLDRHPDLDGLFAASDSMAAAAVGVLLDAGRRIPEDVAVVGFDDTPVAMTVRPMLSTVRQPIEAMGREMSRLLLRRIDDPADAPSQVVFATELVVRESSVVS